MGRRDKLALHAQSVTLLPALALDRIRKDPPSLGLTSGLSHALFSCMPVENLFRVAWVGRIGICVILLFVVLGLLSTEQAGREGRVGAFKHYRLTSLEQRDGLPPSTPGVAKFGLLRYGEGDTANTGVQQGGLKPCKAGDAEGGTWEVHGAAMTLTLRERPAGDFAMWFIETLGGEGTEGGDSVRFKLEGADDPEGAWSVVGSSASVQYYVKTVHTHGVAPTPLERGAVLRIDATKGFAQMYYHVQALLIYLCWLFVVGAAMFGKALVARRGLFTTFKLQFMTRAIGGILFLQSGVEEDRQIHALRAFSTSALSLVSFVLIQWREELLEVVFFWIGVCVTCIQAWTHWRLFGEPLSFRKGLGSLSYSVFFFFISLTMMLARVFVLRKVIKNTRKSKRQFDAAWEGVVARERNEVCRVARLVGRIKESTAGKKALQLNRSAKEQGPGVGIRRRLRSLRRVSTATDTLQSGSLRLEMPPWGVAGEDAVKGEAREGGVGCASDGGGAGGGEAEPGSCRAGTGGGPPDGSMIGVTDSSTSLRTAMSSLLPNPWRSSNPFLTSGRRVLPVAGAGIESWEGYLAQNLLQRLGLIETLRSRSQPEFSLGQPVETLDQLYSQAFLVQDDFFEVVASLARLFGGKFRLRPTEGARRVEFGEWEEGESGKFLLGGVKRVKSSITKLDRAYNRDVSRLLDVCRETIYFDTVDQLRRCLAAISENPRLEIVRLKSTMEAEQDTREGGYDGGWLLASGMRFVGVYVRLRGVEGAKRLCVDSHVCELLLVLTDVGRIAHAPHTREAYCDWRMCKRVIAFLLPFYRSARQLFCNQGVGRRTDGAAGPAERERGGNGEALAGEKGGNCEASGGIDESGRSTASNVSPLNSSHSECQPEGGAAAAEDGPRGVESVFEAGSSVRPTLQIVSVGNENSAHPSPANLNSSGQRAGAGLPGARGGGSVGSYVSGEMETLLEGISCMSALGLCDFLDHRWEEVQRGHDQRSSTSSSFSGIFFSTQRPMTSALQKWPMRVILIGIGVFYLLRGVSNTLQYASLSDGEVFPPYRHYRLQTVLTRDRSEGNGITSPGISVFGVLDDSR